MAFDSVSEQLEDEPDRRNVHVAPMEPIAVSPARAAELLGVSRPTIYELLHSGRLPSVKVGARRLIATSALRALVEPAELS